MANQGSFPAVRIYADEDEQETMALCDEECIKILASFLDLIPHHQTFRGIDIGGGDGRLAIGLLLNKYNMVDLIDICPVAVKRAR